MTREGQEHKENHSPSAKLWVEHKQGSWKLVSDLATFRLCKNSDINGTFTMEIAYDDVKKLLSHIGDTVQPVTTAIAVVVPPVPPPSTGKFGITAEV